MEQVDCIITAAGLSSRMGKWKMMLPWQEGTILDASIKNALQFCSHIILVTGFRAEVLQERYYQQPGITLVHNPDYQQGLFSSVRAGVQNAQSPHCFITHGDLPCLNRHIFQTLWQQRDEGAILPRYQGVPGHPILVATRYLQQLLLHPHAGSIRQLLLNGQHQQLELNSPEIIFDIDTPADFIRLQLRRY